MCTVYTQLLVVVTNTTASLSTSQRQMPHCEATGLRDHRSCGSVEREMQQVRAFPQDANLGLIVNQTRQHLLSTDKGGRTTFIGALFRASRKILPRRGGCMSSLQRKAAPMRSACSATCTSTAKAGRKTLPRRGGYLGSL